MVANKRKGNYHFKTPEDIINGNRANKSTDRTKPFEWVWDVDICRNGDIDVFLKEKAADYAGGYTEEVKVLSYTKSTVQKYIDKNCSRNKFAQVNFERWVANEADKIKAELEKEIFSRFKKSRTSNISLIMSGRINPAYEERINYLAKLKTVSAIYKTYKCVDSIYDFPID